MKAPWPYPALCIGAMKARGVYIAYMAVGVKHKGNLLIPNDIRRSDSNLYTICVPDDMRLAAQAGGKSTFWLISEDLA